jgi:hypothetical protein
VSRIAFAGNLTWDFPQNAAAGKLTWDVPQKSAAMLAWMGVGARQLTIFH